MPPTTNEHVAEVGQSANPTSFSQPLPTTTRQKSPSRAPNSWQARQRTAPAHLDVPSMQNLHWDPTASQSPYTSSQTAHPYLATPSHTLQQWDGISSQAAHTGHQYQWDGISSQAPQTPKTGHQYLATPSHALQQWDGISSQAP